MKLWHMYNSLPPQWPGSLPRLSGFHTDCGLAVVYCLKKSQKANGVLSPSLGCRVGKSWCLLISKCSIDHCNDKNCPLGGNCEYAQELVRDRCTSIKQRTNYTGRWSLKSSPKATQMNGIRATSESGKFHRQEKHSAQLSCLPRPSQLTRQCAREGKHSRGSILSSTGALLKCSCNSLTNFDF